MIEYREGDLLASGLGALAHGCNCQGAMGAGIARGFRDRWPDMYSAYRELCAAGTFRPGDVFTWRNPDAGLIVFCLATQRGTGPCAEPRAITAAVAEMIRLAYYDLGIREIGLPMIGCGLGGLAPETLDACLAPFASAPVTLAVYHYAPQAGNTKIRRHDHDDRG